MQQIIISEEHKKFGAHLKKLREKLGKSLTMFCYENDLSKASISRIERGNADFRYSTLLKLADALEISMPELLDLDKKD